MSNAKYIQEGYTAITAYLYAKLDLIDFPTKTRSGSAPSQSESHPIRPGATAWGGVKDTSGNTWWIATNKVAK
jgi:hypothetical protein